MFYAIYYFDTNGTPRYCEVREIINTTNSSFSGVGVNGYIYNYENVIVDRISVVSIHQ